MSCSSAPTQQQVGPVDAAGERRRLDAVSTRCRSTVNRCTALRCGRLRTRSQSGSSRDGQPGLVERLPDRRRRRGPAPSRLTKRVAAPARGHGSGSGGHSAASRSTVCGRQPQPGLRSRGSGPQHERRVVGRVGRRGRAPPRRPARPRRRRAARASPSRADAAADRAAAARPRASARPGARSRRARTRRCGRPRPTWRSSASASQQAEPLGDRRPAPAARAGRAARPVTACSASRTSSSALPGVVEPCVPARRPPRTRRRRAARQVAQPAARLLEVGLEREGQVAGRARPARRQPRSSSGSRRRACRASRRAPPARRRRAERRVAGDVPQVEQPEQRPQVVARRRGAPPAAVRTEWSSRSPASQIGYQSRSATCAPRRPAAVVRHEQDAGRGRCPATSSPRP